MILNMNTSKPSMSHEMNSIQKKLKPALPQSKRKSGIRKSENIRKDLNFKKKHLRDSMTL